MMLFKVLGILTVAASLLAYRYYIPIISDFESPVAVQMVLGVQKLMIDMVCMLLVDKIGTFIEFG